MIWLWLVTLLWAFSFSLIGVYLAAEVDGYIAVFSRMLLALIVFLPYLKWRSVQSKTAITLMAIGAVQIGLMYLFFYHSFLYLSVPEVLLFTIMTPVYVTLIDELVFLRQFHFRWLASAFLAVIGAAIIRYQSLSEHFVTGMLLVQCANLCFAFGQVAYKRLIPGNFKQQRETFGWFFVGSTALTGIACLILANPERLPSTTTHYTVLLWLGVVASGVGYFLWNYGAKQVNTAQLAVMNNVLIPAGLLVNFLFWNKTPHWTALLIGGAIMIVAVWLASFKSSKQTLQQKTPAS
jgi:carboxylate/amino acid/amine transporter